MLEPQLGIDACWDAFLGSNALCLPVRLLRMKQTVREKDRLDRMFLERLLSERSG